MTKCITKLQMAAYWRAASAAAREIGEPVDTYRKAQKRYFAEKTQSALIASKEAERALDAHMEMLRSASSRKPQLPAGIEVPNV